MITATAKPRSSSGRIYSVSPPTTRLCMRLGIPHHGVFRLPSSCRRLHTYPSLRDVGVGGANKQNGKMGKLEDLVVAQAAYISSTVRGSDSEAWMERLEKLEETVAAQAAEIEAAKSRSEESKVTESKAAEKRSNELDDRFNRCLARVSDIDVRVVRFERGVNGRLPAIDKAISRSQEHEKVIQGLVTTKVADKYMKDTKSEIAALQKRVDTLEKEKQALVAAAAAGGGGEGEGSVILTPAAKSGKPSPLEIRLEKLFTDLKHHPRRFSPPSSLSTPLGEFSFAPNSAPVPSERLVRNGDPKQVLVFIDGSCLASGTDDSRPGYGIYFRREDNVYGRLEEFDGDGSAVGVSELWAAIVALQLRPWREEGFERVVLASDAEYVVMGVCEHAEKWAAKGWKIGGKPMPGKDVWEKLLFELAVQEARGVRVQFWLIPRKLNLADPVARKGSGFDMAEIRTRHQLLREPSPPPLEQQQEWCEEEQEQESNVQELQERSDEEASPTAETQLKQVPSDEPKGFFGSLFGLLRSKSTGPIMTETPIEPTTTTSAPPAIMFPPLLPPLPLSPEQQLYLQDLSRLTDKPSPRQEDYYRSILLDPHLDPETITPPKNYDVDFSRFRSGYYITYTLTGHYAISPRKKEHQQIKQDANTLIALSAKLLTGFSGTSDGAHVYAIITANVRKISLAAEESAECVQRARTEFKALRKGAKALFKKNPKMTARTQKMVFMRMVLEKLVRDLDGMLDDLNGMHEAITGGVVPKVKAIKGGRTRRVMSRLG